MKEGSEIWEGDLLNRKEEAIFLQKYIENVYQSVAKDTSFVLNINSEWGHGKTWFLKRFCEQLKYNYPTVYFDAWRNDFTKDALLSFVSVVCNELSIQFRKDTQVQRKIDFVKTKFKKILKKSAPVVAAVLTKQLTGLTTESLRWDESKFNEDVINTAEKLAGVAATNLVEDFLEKQNGIDAFGEAISSLVAEIEKSSGVSLPVCVIVDELDRCRPTYAIELLESIKHLFDVKGVVFILATDTKQLSHSIKAVYGSEFASTAYLKRFFSAEYQLSEPDYERLANFLFERFRFDDRIFMPQSISLNINVAQFFAITSRYFKLTARDQYQIFDLLATVLLSSGNKIFHLPFLLLLIILKHKFENESLATFSQRSSTQIHELLNKLHVSGLIVDQQIPSRYFDKEGARQKMAELTILFEFYFSLLDTNKDINAFLRRSIGWEYQEEIALRLKTANDLPEYFELLAQAGRLKVVK